MYVDILTGENLSSIYLSNMDSWSVRSSIRRGGDGVKGILASILASCDNHLSEYMKIWCNIQLIIYGLERYKFCRQTTILTRNTKKKDQVLKVFTIMYRKILPYISRLLVKKSRHCQIESTNGNLMKVAKVFWLTNKIYTGL